MKLGNASIVIPAPPAERPALIIRKSRLSGGGRESSAF
jgi:hypothetical protein